MEREAQEPLLAARGDPVADVQHGHRGHVARRARWPRSRPSCSTAYSQPVPDRSPVTNTGLVEAVRERLQRETDGRSGRTRATGAGEAAAEARRRRPRAAAATPGTGRVGGQARLDMRLGRVGVAVAGHARSSGARRSAWTSDRGAGRGTVPRGRRSVSVPWPRTARPRAAATGSAAMRAIGGWCISGSSTATTRRERPPHTTPKRHRDLPADGARRTAPGRGCRWPRPPRTPPSTARTRCPGSRARCAR